MKTLDFAIVLLLLSACAPPAPEPTAVDENGAAEKHDEVVPREDTIVFAGPVEGSVELFSCSIADPTPSRLTRQRREVGFPVWSPDGARIVFVAMSEDSADLMLFDTSTGNTTILLPDYFELADWDPTGDRLLVGLESGLHFLDVATGAMTRVETGSTADAYGRCARESALIAYESGRDGNPEIYVTRLATGETTRLTDNPDLDEWPSPSRDGEHIVWASGTEEDKNLWIMNSDGSDKRQITKDLLLGDAFPEWSPDDSRILFTVNEGGSFRLKLLDVRSGEINDFGEGAAASWR